jgi:phosphoribosylformimino-5-aminoimidazole carboxamide ribotide isomerase
MSELSIEQVRPEVTWRLRQKVLYPQQHFLEMQLDEDADGIHFGGFQDDRLVCVVSLFKNDVNYQFRKLAVEHEYQHKGIGSKMLSYITDFVKNEGGKQLWCNARVSAIPFYIKHGFLHTGKLFSNKEGIEFEILEKQFRA